MIADVIDDERQWPVRDTYREKLTQNYEEVLARSDLVLTNCQSVFQSMYGLSQNIHLLPNAVEPLEEESGSWRKPRELRRLTGPVIGYVGNLDIARIDLDLLRDVVRERPDWHFVFIGSMHRGENIRELKKYENVHFLGVRVYERALRYIRHFNAAIIPHLDNQLTKNMNPLKLYVYHALFVPVVSTPIANIGDFGKFVRIGRTPQEFVRAIDECLSDNPLTTDLSHLRVLLKENSWPERVKRVLELIEQEFANPLEPLSLVGPVIRPEDEAAISSGVKGAELHGPFGREECVGQLRKDVDVRVRHKIAWSKSRCIFPNWHSLRSRFYAQVSTETAGVSFRKSIIRERSLIRASKLTLCKTIIHSLPREERCGACTFSRRRPLSINWCELCAGRCSMSRSICAGFQTPMAST